MLKASKSALVVGLLVAQAIFSLRALAGTTGKIVGVIKDAQTGEPLPAANVIIEGTQIGAATDDQGRYIIIAVPPGDYTLRAWYIGYAEMRKRVHVSTDLTTVCDFSLQQKVIEAKKSVVVVAQRPIVEMDRTSTAAYVTSQELNTLPVEEVHQVIALQAGVVRDAGGGLHFRGGRVGEVAYYIDGIPVTNQFSAGGGSLVGINNRNVQELQVISGTFNAEYGQAQSGVISVVTKIPDRQHSGSFTFYTGDYISGHKDIFMGLDRLHPGQILNAEGSVTGPLLGGGKLGFYYYTRLNRDLGYFFGKRLTRPSDAWPIAVFREWYRRRYPSSDEVIYNRIPIPDSLMTGDGSLVPMDVTRYWSNNLKLTYSLSKSMKLQYSLFTDWRYHKGYNDSYRYAPDGVASSRSWEHTHILKLTHTLSTRMFYEANLAYTDSKSRWYLFENLIDPRLQTVSPMLSRFHLGGTQSGKSVTETGKIFGKVDFTWQVDNYNLVKAGLQFARHKAFYHRRNPEPIQDPILGNNYYPADGTLSFEEFLEKSRPEVLVPPQLTPQGETSLSEEKYLHHPKEFSAYVQDKLELKELILNLGVRFDWFDPDHVKPKNPRVLPEAGSISLLSSTEPVRAKPKWQVSPRLGMAFPISDAGVIHAAYGHFFKVPPFAYIFENSEYKVIGTNETRVGNPDLKPQQTIAYEIGLQQQLAETVGLEVTLFYSDFRNLLGLEIVRQVGNVYSYLRRVNRDYGYNKGFSIHLKKRPSRYSMISGSLDYTFQVGKSNESDPNNIAIVTVGGGRGQFFQQIEKQVLPLDWDQTHTLTGTFTVGHPDNWTLSFIGKFMTGQPYTPTPVRLDVSAKFKNTDRKPNQLGLDMYLSKHFDYGHIKPTLFLRVFNVFDIANQLSVFSTTGRADRDHRFPVEKALEESQLLGILTLHDVDNHPYWYSAPRLVELGITVDIK